MVLPLLQTKLCTPPLRQPLVQRDQLLARLHGSTRHLLTLLSAPAGFGKSTLLAEWIIDLRQQLDDRPVAGPPHNPSVAWLALDAGDNDPVRFWTYVIAALQTVRADLGVAALGLLETPQPVPIEAFLTLLLNDLATLAESCVLVLDDYHVIETPVIHTALTFLIEHLPDGLHLILSGRTDPPLPLSRLRARRQLAELRAADLRFNPAEATAFLNDIMRLSLSSTQIARLETRTEGWIAGLQLAALSMHGRPDKSAFIHAFTGSHRFIVDYLAEEVIERQPEAVQMFLLQTSILERMCGPLCNAVSGRTDSQALLETLHHQNLFIIALDDERKWFRYHHLFAEVLQARLQQANPALRVGVAELHHRASVWYEQQGLMAEAIEHTLASGALEQTVRLIEQMGMMVFAQGATHHQLNQWLAALPAELVRTRPKLGLIHAWLLFNRMDPEAALRRLEEAEQALNRVGTLGDDGDDTDNLRGEIAATRAITSTYRGHFDPAQVNTWAQIALNALHPDNATYRAVVFGALGTAAMQQGDVVRAEQAFAQAATISRAQASPVGHEYMALASVFHLTNMQRARGALSFVINACQQTLDWAATHGAQTSFGAGMLLIQLADLLRARNELATALHHATTGIAISHQGAYPSLFLVGSLVLVRIKQALGDREGIFDIVQQMRQMATNLYQADWLVGLLPAVEAHLRLTQGDFAAALQWAQQADWAEPVPGHFRGTHHFVYAYEYGGITRAQVLIAQATRESAHPGRLAEVMAYLERQGEVAIASGRQWLLIKVHALRALVYQARGDAAQARACLAQAIALAKPEGNIRIFVDEGEAMRLLILAFKAWLMRSPADNQQRHWLAYIDQLIDAFSPAQGLNASSLNPPHSPLQVAKLADAYVPINQALIEPLTPRELEVLQLIAAGHSNREIARTLVVSLGTVKKHLSNIFGKLATESRTQTVARARELQLL